MRRVSCARVDVATAVINARAQKKINFMARLCARLDKVDADARFMKLLIAGRPWEGLIACKERRNSIIVRLPSSLTRQMIYAVRGQDVSRNAGYKGWKRASRGRNAGRSVC